MNIQTINNNYCNPSFTHWERHVYKTNAHGVKELAYCNDTMTYRDGYFWRRFCEFINEFFKDLTKVNVYNWACSDGEESATFIMQMFSKHPNTAEKFTPIYAKDYDPVAIKKAKKHILPLGLMELYKINENTGEKLDEFFTNIPDYYKQLVRMSGEALQNYAYRYADIEPELTRTVNARFRKKYANYIDYEVSDITKDYKKINPEGSIVIMRNFLPYLGEKKAYKLLEHLSKQLKNKCVIALGEYDMDNFFSLPNYLESLGFIWSENCTGVYYKP